MKQKSVIEIIILMVVLLINSHVEMLYSYFNIVVLLNVF